MKRSGDYTFELCWLILVIAIFALGAARSSASARNWDDRAIDCPGIEGWCTEDDKE